MIIPEGNPWITTAEGQEMTVDDLCGSVEHAKDGWVAFVWRERPDGTGSAIFDSFEWGISFTGAAAARRLVEMIINKTAAFESLAREKHRIFMLLVGERQIRVKAEAAIKAGDSALALQIMDSDTHALYAVPAVFGLATMEADIDETFDTDNLKQFTKEGDDNGI